VATAAIHTALGMNATSSQPRQLTDHTGQIDKQSFITTKAGHIANGMGNTFFQINRLV